jgi:hypothetical protein
VTARRGRAAYPTGAASSGGAEEGTRTPTPSRGADFKSAAAADFATPAQPRGILTEPVRPHNAGLSRSFDGPSNGPAKGDEAIRLLFVAVLSAFALIPLSPPHFFASSDGLYHVYRAMEVSRCLGDGVLVCRWMADQFLGYGTPLLNLYSPLVYYVIALFHALGLGWVNATKASMALFMIFSGIAAYAYAADVLSRRAALVVAVAYVYVPYHLTNAYFRGDLPEFAAMAWFPAILWAFGRLARPGPVRDRLPYLVAGATCYAGLVLTHNLSAFLFTGALVLACGAMTVRGVAPSDGGIRGPAWRAAVLLFAALLAAGLSAYLVVPALAEKHLIQIEGLLYISHAEHFPTLAEIMPGRLVHAYGTMFRGSLEYGYKLGPAQVALGALGALAALARWRRFSYRARGEAVLSVLLLAVAFWFTRPESAPAWDAVPLLPFAQFPWRFLLLMALPASLLAGFLVDALPERARQYAAPALVAAVVATSTLGLRPIMANATDTDVEPADATRFELMYHLMGTTAGGEYIPVWARDKPFVSPEALAIALGGSAPAVHAATSDPWVAVERLEKGADRQVFRTTGDTPGRIVLNTAYFPGWRATVDGQAAEIGITQPQGLIALQIPAGGERRIELHFEDTPVRAAAELVSLASLAIVLGLLVAAYVGAPSSRRRVASLTPRPLRREGAGGEGYAAERKSHAGRASAGWRRGLLPRLGLLVAVVALLPFGVAFYSAGYQPPPVARYPLKVNLGDTLMLLGYDLRVDGRPLERNVALPPGTTLELSTYWQTIGRDAERAVRARPYARLTNIDEQNWDFATEQARTSVGDGTVFRSDHLLRAPSGLPPGLYQIDVGALSRDGRPLPIRDMELVELLPSQGWVRIGPVQVAAAPAAPAESLRVASGARYDERVLLDSFDLQIGLSERRSTPEPIPIDGVARARAGETLQLDLLWRALRSRPGDVTVRASLEDKERFVWAVRESEPVDRMYPAWIWSDGEAVRDQLRMPLPPETPPGRYQVRLTLAENGRTLPALAPTGATDGGGARLIDLELARSEAQARDRDVQITERHREKVADDLELLGREIGRDVVAAGDSLDVTLIWRATRDVGPTYRARLSVVGPDGRRWGEVVAAPAGEANPTDRWERGDVFRGRYRLQLSPESPRGEGRLVLELTAPEASAPIGRAELGTLTLR